MSAHSGPPPGGPPQRPHQPMAPVGPPPRTTPPIDERAPRLLPLAFLSAFAVAVPTVLFLLLFGVLNLDLGAGSVVVLIIATLICLLGPVAGIIAGFRAVQRCRSAPKVGGALLIVGCALQILMMVVMCVVLPNAPRVVTAVIILVAAGALPALLNLIGGILGLRRATMS